MNGFDRIVEGEENWFHGHRSLLPTPQEYHASLRHELQKLKDAISMPNEKFAGPKWPVEKRGREDEELQKKKMAEFRSNLQTSNLQESRNTWKSGVAKQSRHR